MKKSKNLNLLLKILMIFIAILLIHALKNEKVFALSYQIDCPSTANVGDTISIKVSGMAESWKLSLQVNGATIASGDHMGDNLEETSFNISGNYTISSAGTYTVTVVGNIATGIETPIRSFESKTITVSEPTPPPTEPEQPEQPEEPGEGNETGDPITGGETGGNEQIPTPPPTEPEQPEQQKSSNNHLASLTTDIGTLTPKFNRDRIEYTLKFPDDFDYKNLSSFKITAYVEDSRSRVEGNVVVSVQEGDNTFEVKCIAEDGTPRTYKINVYKPIEIKQSDLRLKDLTINSIDDTGTFSEIKLSEGFSPEQFEYTIDVGNNITDLDIKTDIENKDIIIKIEGEKALREGENVITITLTSPTDENVKSVYKINVNKEVAIDAISNSVVDENIMSSNTSNSSSRRKYLIMVVALVVILAIAVIILLIINHKNKYESDYLRVGKKDDDEDDEVTIGKKDKSYLKDENLEKFTKKYEELENNKKESKEKSEENIEKIILDEKIKEEKPEFKRDIMVDAETLSKINDEIEKTQEKDEEISSDDDNEVSKKLEELMEKKVENHEIESDKNTNDNFSKEDFFNEINKKKGRHF